MVTVNHTPGSSSANKGPDGRCQRRKRSMRIEAKPANGPAGREGSSPGGYNDSGRYDSDFDIMGLLLRRATAWQQECRDTWLVAASHEAALSAQIRTQPDDSGYLFLVPDEVLLHGAAELGSIPDDVPRVVVCPHVPGNGQRSVLLRVAADRGDVLWHSHRLQQGQRLCGRGGLSTCQLARVLQILEVLPLDPATARAPSEGEQLLSFGYLPVNAWPKFCLILSVCMSAREAKAVASHAR
jgi:hypothetical protein